MDDEDELVEMMAEMINLCGYRTKSFTRSSEALEAFDRNPGQYDLAIVDMAMPGLTGLALATAFREIRSELPIILCTGYEDRQWESSSHGIPIFNRILVKPIKFSQLAEAMHSVLNPAD